MRHSSFAVTAVLFSWLALALSGVLCAADLSLETAKLSVSSIDGSSRLSESFSLTQSPKVASPLSIESDEVLRLSFTLKDASGEKLSAERVPHQVVVALTDASDSSITSTSMVTVKRASGKATWSQRIDRLPASVLRGSSGVGQLHVTLLLGSFGDVDPIQLPLLTVQLPPTLTTGAPTAISARERKERAQGFHRHADHHHTFAVPAAEQMPPRIVSLLSALATLVVPWLVLAALYVRLAPSLNVRSPAPATYPFLASLAALELLAFMYWQGAGLTLFKMLPWLALFSLASILAGRSALTEMRRTRLGKQA